MTISTVENTPAAKEQSNNFWARLSLQAKTLTILLAVALTPLVGMAAYNTIQTRNALEDAAKVSLNANAAQTSSSLDAYIKSTLDGIRAEAQSKDLVDFLLLDPAERKDSYLENDALSALRTFERKDPINILSYGLIDQTGKNILDETDDNIGKSEADIIYFQKVYETDLPYTSPVIYTDAGARVIYFASPVRNAQGETIGVLRAKYNAIILQQIANTNAQASSTGTNTSIILLDEYNIRLADTNNFDAIQTSVTPLTTTLYTTAVKEGRLKSSLSAEEQASNNVALANAIKSADQAPFFEADIYPDISGVDSGSVSKMKTQPWTVIVSQPSSLLFHDAQQQTLLSILVSVLAAIILTIIAYFTSRSLTNPISALTKTANEIASGSLQSRAYVQTQDEIGTLASAFNRMTDQLSQTLQGLERRVEERTHELSKQSTELEIASRQIQRRAAQFEALAQVSQSIASIRDLQELLPFVTQVVSESYGFYHVGLFLIDEAGEYAVLTAANSEGGQRMLARQHRLKVGEQGIVGSAAGTGQPRIALDVGADAVFFNNPDLPETHSEMALPIKREGKVIGALDVQSTESGAFSDEDVQTLSLLADQVSLAIENARLFESSKRSLNELQTVMRQTTRETWKRLPQQQNLIGYRYNTMGSSPLKQPIKVNGEGKATSGEATSVIVPIELRGEVIGNLIVHSPNESGWNTDERDLIKAVAERVALSAENARLFDETTQRAERERLVSEITGKIRSHTDPQVMIDTAIKELRDALGASRVEIVPKDTAPNGGKDKKE